MNKYGINNFTIEQVEECLPEELNGREEYWIEYYNSFKNGYNATIGGDGKHYIDYDLVVSTYKEIQNVTKVSQLLKIDQTTIRKILRNYNIKIISSSEQSRLKSLQKPVAKCDKNTGEILEIYPSLAEAEKKNGSPNHISEVCRGKRKTCQGYKWKFLEK